MSSHIMSSGTPAIVTEGLTKHYGSVKALVDLDLTVHRGEVFGFLGPNGAGKTTMIRTILDEIRPTAGRAWIMGMDTHRQSVDIRHGLGYLPSDFAAYPTMTGRDLISYFARLRGGVDWSYVATLAERLQSDLDRKLGDLSSGNRQKIGLIQALMNRPDVLIMDEPSAGLDPIMQRELQTMMREVAAEGRTVFLSSHALGEVQRVADRVGIIRAGHLVALETVADLRAKALRSIEFTFEQRPRADMFDGVPGVRDVTASNRHLLVSFDGTVKTLLAALDDDNPLLDISTEDADLEEIFLTYYVGDEAVEPAVFDGRSGDGSAGPGEAPGGDPGRADELVDH
jgi:ABC-2 type transport system ATP-binding protein